MPGCFVGTVNETQQGIISAHHQVPSPNEKFFRLLIDRLFRANIGSVPLVDPSVS